MTAPIRIFKVTYTSAPVPGVRRRRRAETFVKVPYGGAFGMTEVLTRMTSVGQIARFSVAAATAGESTPEIRKGLERWLPALTHTSDVTGVDWTA